MCSSLLSPLGHVGRHVNSVPVFAVPADIVLSVRGVFGFHSIVVIVVVVVVALLAVLVTLLFSGRVGEAHAMDVVCAACGLHDMSFH